MVSEFTHRDCVKEIKRMRHVTTDLGRGKMVVHLKRQESVAKIT